MKKIFSFLLLLTFIFNNESSASHASGAEIIYKCLGNNKYIVRYTLYRNCSGIYAPNTILMNFESTCGSFTRIFSPIPNSPIQIQTVCPLAATTCDSIPGTYIGIEQWTYADTVTLSSPCSNWVVSHSENARSGALTTITGAGADNLFVYALINNTNGICNNSPSFNNLPVFTGCLGEASCINPGAFDLEGDSLVFSQIIPRTGPSLYDTVTYLVGYSASQPIISSPAATFNSTTGELCMHPAQQDISPIAILVSEYRNGVLIGEIERDIQLMVTACNNALPSITGINSTPISEATICALDPFCFYVTTLDADSSGTTSLNWNHGIPTAAFTTSGSQLDSGFFCWTPTLSDTGSTPHCFEVTVNDNACPYVGVQTKRFCLTVESGFPNCATASIQPLDLSAPINIYPQPSTSNFYIDLGNNFNQHKNYSVSFYDPLGRVVYQSTINERVTLFDNNKFASSGIHFILINNESGKVLSRSKIQIIKNQ